MASVAVDGKQKFGILLRDSGKMIAKKKNTLQARLKLMGTINKRNPGTTLCRKCGDSFCMKNSILCNDCLITQEDTVRGMPTRINMMHCQFCCGYSFTGRTDFVFAPLKSAALLKYLLKRIEFHFYKLQLDLVDASFLPMEHNSNRIRVALLLENGSNRITRHTVVYTVDQRTCFTCLLSNNCKGPDTHLNYIVHVRHGGRTNSFTFLGKLLNLAGAAKRCKRVTGGLDFFFSTDDDAVAFFNVLHSRFLVRSDNLRTNTDVGSSMFASIYPAYCDDLICIRSSKVLAVLGSSRAVAVAICTNVNNTMSLLDPLSLTETILTADECWSEPDAVEVYKSWRDLVEYVVLDVQVVAKGNLHSLAVAEVARVSDFGKNDTMFTTTTHLGAILKPGDNAYGYDLYSAKNSNMMAHGCRDSLPDVVLIRKKYETTRVGRKKKKSQRNRKKKTCNSGRKKKTCPEYDEFLKDLEKNHEAMINLSLNGENKADQNQQQPEIGSVNPGGHSDFDLEGLLADLVLGDQQDGNAPGHCD